MITRSLLRPATGERRRPHVRARGTRASYPVAAGPGAWVRGAACLLERASGATREQVGRATASSNYWSASTDNHNPDNAWNVNFNNGNVNNDNKNNNNHVRAVRSGS